MILSPPPTQHSNILDDSLPSPLSSSYPPTRFKAGVMHSLWYYNSQSSSDQYAHPKYGYCL